MKGALFYEPADVAFAVNGSPPWPSFLECGLGAIAYYAWVSNQRAFAAALGGVVVMHWLARLAMAGVERTGATAYLRAQSLPRWRWLRGVLWGLAAGLVLALLVVEWPQVAARVDFRALFTLGLGVVVGLLLSERYQRLVRRLRAWWLRRELKSVDWSAAAAALRRDLGDRAQPRDLEVLSESFFAHPTEDKAIVLLVLYPKIMPTFRACRRRS